MAGTLAFRVNLGTVLEGIRVRRLRAYELCNAAAEEIAGVLETDLIPKTYPGKVGDSLVAVAEPARTGAYLHAVRVKTTMPLWRWYEFGTKPHIIQAVNKQALAFDWVKMGGIHIVTVRVGDGETTVSAPAHDLRGAFAEQMRAIAFEYWHAALQEAMMVP